MINCFKVFFTLLLVVILGQVAQAEEVLVLKKRNTLDLRYEVNYSSIKSLQQRAIEMSNRLSKDEEIFLFLDTPGGGISAGQELLTTLQSLPQKVNTITNFAASMGYITVQTLGTRYILATGTLMSHRAYIGEEGQVPGEFNTRSTYWLNRILNIEKAMASRVGLSIDSYQKLIKDEFWVDGKDAVASKHADKVVSVRCDDSLQGTKTEAISTPYGDIKLVWAECPVITVPLKVDFSDLTFSYTELDRAKLANVKETVLELLYNKKEFYKKYILSNKGKDIFL